MNKQPTKSNRKTETQEKRRPADNQQVGQHPNSQVAWLAAGPRRHSPGLPVTRLPGARALETAGLLTCLCMVPSATAPARWPDEPMANTAHVPIIRCPGQRAADKSLPLCCHSLLSSALLPYCPPVLGDPRPSVAHLCCPLCCPCAASACSVLWLARVLCVARVCCLRAFQRLAYPCRCVAHRCP